jgi:tetratricopeptide (TPR) repeat protein
MRRSTLPFVILALLACTLVPAAAHATVLKSNIPGAHFKATGPAQAELNRVKSRINLNNLEGAMEAARAAALKDSLSGEVFDVIGTLALRQGNYPLARNAFEQAAALAPEQAAIWNRLAQVSLLQLGLEEQGLQALTYAIAADSSYSSSYYTQFMYHWARCEFDEAREAIQHARAIELDQGRSLIWYSTQLGFDMTMGDYGAAAGAIQLHLAQVQNDIGARQLLVQAQRGAGDPKAALETIRPLLVMDPRQPIWLAEAGLAKRALGERDSAYIFFSRAVTADSMSYDSGYNRALELLARRDTTKAWAELRRLRNVDPGNWLTPLLASRIARAQGDTTRAALALEEARRLNPAMGLSRAARAGAAAAVPAWTSPDLEAAEDLMEKGEFALAGDKLYQAAREPGKRGAALYWLSRVTRISGTSGGLPVIAAEAAAEETHGDPVVLRALAEAEIAVGDRTRTLAALEAVKKAAPDDLIASALEAEVRHRSGDIAGARAVFNEIAREPTRSYRLESVRASVLGATNDAGASIARPRAAGVVYLKPGS